MLPPQRRLTGSIATQVLGLFLLAILVPLAVALLQTRYDTQAAEARAVGDARAVAGLAADQVADAIDDASAAATTIERLPAFWRGHDGDRDEMLEALLGPHPAFNALLFYGGDLQQHGSSSPTGRAQRTEVPGRAYAREALAEGRTAFTSEPIVTLTGQVAVLPVAIPLRDTRSGATGLLVAGLKVDRLPSLWSRTTLPAGSRLTLIDTRSGRVLATDRGTEGLAQTGAVDALLGAIQRGEPGSRQVDVDGTERLVASAAVVGTPWVVAVGVPLTAVLGPIDQSARFRLATSLAVAAGTAILLLLLWQRIGFRLRLLHRAADRWASEEWGHRTGAAGDDELGGLASALDKMAARLDTTSRELVARNAERELDERRRAALLRVAQALAEQDETRRIVATVEVEAAEALAADVALVALWDDERGSLWPTHAAEPPLTEWRQSLSRPLLHEGRLLGTISVGRLDAERPFTVEDGEFMELLASLGAAHLVGHERTRLAGVVLAARTAQHELNNRLTRVVGYAELLTCEPTLDADARRMVEMVLDGANDAARIVVRMGAVARLEEVEWGGGVGSTIDLERSLAR